jgi:hypothetical protein
VHSYLFIFIFTANVQVVEEEEEVVMVEDTEPRSHWKTVMFIYFGISITFIQLINIFRLSRKSGNDYISIIIYE